VRTFAIVFLTIGLVSIVQAQTQERSLVDRLLKPDMSLQNSEQNKKFRADGESIDKHATVGAFYFENKSNPRAFFGSRDFQSRQFDARSFADQKRRSSSSDKRVSAVSTYPGSSLQYPVREAYDHDKAAQGREFAGQRPFLERGKSQKFLDHPNAPMTIEQVRELLNKNK
jgi:hypothetical protein